MKKFAPILIALLLVGGYFGYSKFMGGGPKESPAVAQARIKSEQKAEKKERLKSPIEGPVHQMTSTFIVTLPGVERHFAKFAVALLVDDKTPIEAAAGEGGGGAALPMEEEPEARDIIIRIVSTKTVDDLLDAEKREELKTEIKDELNKELAESVVLDVYFTDFAVQ